MKYLDYTFTVSPFATSGNKSIKFKANYFENSAPAEGSFSTQFTVIDGYDASAMSVMVQSYKLYVDDTEVSGLMAGEETELRLTLINNSKYDTAKKIISSLVFTNSPGLTLCVGGTDTAYADSIKPGGTATLKYKIMAKQEAEVGPAMLGINLTYETTEAVAGKAAQNIMLPVSQKMDILAGTPEVYGTPSKDKEATISVPLTNMGRAKAMNIRVLATDGMTAAAPCYVGDLLAGGSTSADVTVGFSKIGAFMGKMILQYEDANGETYSQDISVPLSVAESSADTDANSVNANKDGTDSRWWLWLLIAILALILIGIVVYVIIRYKKGVFTTEGGDNIITVTLPAGTPLNDMHPQLQLSDYATILAPDLTGGITFVKDTKTAFTVQAEDGKTTKTYYVVVKLSDEEKPSGAEIYTDTIMLKDANILRDLDILGKNITTGTDSTDIELLLDAGKDTSNLMIYARLSYGATASPALDGKKGMNLSDWTTFTITSGDGTNTRTYRIKATARTQASISAFSLTIGGTVYEGVIDNKANTITVSGVDDSNLSSTSFAPDVTLGPETLVCSPAPGLAQDFSRTVQYIVAGNEKVLSRTYTVSVLNKAGQLISGSGGGGGSDPVTPATGAKITAFSVLGVDGVINQSAGTITVTLPAGTNVTAVAPSVTVTAGAVVSPVPGEVVNLTAPVVYTVTLGEETSRYTVTVTFERSVSQQLWDELGNNSDVADHQTSHTKRDWS